MTVDKSSKNIWFDHDAISDGSDGNLDITHASDFITISYTKFFYSTKRTDPNDTGAVGHRVCNLIGHSDSNSSEDTGHLNVTFHHNWWADNVMERMPRVRFGKVHVFNNLYTAAGNNYAVGLGVLRQHARREQRVPGRQRPARHRRLLELVQHPPVGRATCSRRRPATPPAWARRSRRRTTTRWTRPARWRARSWPASARSKQRRPDVGRAVRTTVTTPRGAHASGRLISRPCAPAGALDCRRSRDGRRSSRAPSAPSVRPKTMCNASVYQRNAHATSGRTPANG